MSHRRRFIHQSALAGLTFVVPAPFSRLKKTDNVFSYQSEYLKVKLFKNRPEFAFFSIDSLGKNDLFINPLLKKEQSLEKRYGSRTTADSIIWSLNQVPVWECRMKPRSISLVTHWNESSVAHAFDITFSQRANHCTVLGTMAEDNQVKFPCILHFPGLGTFHLSCSCPDVSLFYDSELTSDPYIKIALPAADRKHKHITYTFESTTIYPALNQIMNDSTYDGFKKNFINIFQLNPRRKILSNNSTSDACAFTVFLYAEMARKTPPLTNDLTAMDLVRNTLNEYLNGLLGYGMVGKPNWQSEFNSSDSFPSLIIAACYYILHTKDTQWAEKNYEGIKRWAKEMIKTDTNNDGIIEYGYTGNSGSWNDNHFKRPANWWDTIGFGHDDAYSNALAYRACILLSDVAGQLNNIKDQRHFHNFARKLRNNYYSRFYNPQTGVLGGWRSKDGQLHDYYFTFINSIAICYDLISKQKGKKIMRTMLNKMKEVGYTDYRLGLPGNLIPIADRDYAHHDPRWGYQHFQVYENGGATGCYVYYTIHALFKLGMKKEAKNILSAMLKSYKEGNFSGSCFGSKMTKDWKTWKGECWGYEGFLVDNYLALLNVLDDLEE